MSTAWFRLCKGKAYTHTHTLAHTIYAYTYIENFCEAIKAILGHTDFRGLGWERV